MAKQCSHTDCSYPVFSKGLCVAHWRPVYSKPLHNQVTLRQTDKVPAKPFKIKVMSDKTAEQYKKYRIIRDRFLKEHPVCEYPGCNSTKVELHHAKGRCGALLTAVEHFKALCRAHHQLIETEPLHAVKMGLSASRLNKL